MGNKLYVGNIPYTTDETALKDLFSSIGNVSTTKIIIDRKTGRSKGFGFVEMATDTEAMDAIDRLDGSDFNGRTIKVNEARPKAFD